jgi:hypothetical protein
MNRKADRQREEATAAVVLRGKEETRDFDVFLAHNSRVKQHVKRLAAELRRRGTNPWLDKEQIRPGRPFQDEIQAAIIIGRNQLGPMQELELKALISRFVEAKIPVIPVLLPGVERLPEHRPRSTTWYGASPASTREEVTPSLPTPRHANTRRRHAPPARRSLVTAAPLQLRFSVCLARRYAVRFSSEAFFPGLAGDGAGVKRTGMLPAGPFKPCGRRRKVSWMNRWPRMRFG